MTESTEKKRVYLASPHMSEQGYEMAFIQEAFATNWIAPLGPNVDAFEKEVVHRVGVKAALAVSSGTAAIHLALKAVGLVREIWSSARISPSQPRPIPSATKVLFPSSLTATIPGTCALRH